MQLQYVILADSAQILPDGTFVIIRGGVEYINAPSFPAMNPSLALVARVALNPDDFDHEHRFRVELQTPDGTNVTPAQGNSTFTPRAHAATNQVFTPGYVFVVNFPGLVFPMAGTYQFRLFVDDQEVGATPINLQTVSESPQTSA